MLSHYLYFLKCCFWIKICNLVLLLNYIPFFVAVNQSLSIGAASEFRYCNLVLLYNGPKGRPNNLPQPAWRLVELFFWSDLSWSRADLCHNSYVSSTHFCLLSTMPSCTRYQHRNWTYYSQCIIQNKHAQIICNIRPNRFSSHLWLFIFFEFWIICTDQIISWGVVFNENKTMLTDSLLIWALSTICLGIWECARGAPQQLAISMVPCGAILLVRFELITSRSLS